MSQYEIPTVITVTSEQIDDIVTTALEGGITYWCDNAYAKPSIKDKYTSEALTRGSRIRLHDMEEDKWHVLTLEKFLRTLGDMQFNFDDYDAIDADSAVQRAIFGEVIYG